VSVSVSVCYTHTHTDWGELWVLSEQVKQAEADALLRHAQDKVARVERMVEDMLGALKLGCRGAMLLRSLAEPV